MQPQWIQRLFGSCMPLNAFLSRIRRQRRTAATAIVIETLEERQMLTPVSWISTNDGFWDDPANWSTGQVPDSGSDVTIDVPGASPVITVRDNRTVGSIISRESLVVSNATLQINSASQIDASTLSVDGAVVGSGPLVVTSSGKIDFESGFLGFSSWTNSGTIDVSADTDVRIGGNLTNNGLITQSGNGNLLFDGSTKLTNSATGIYDFTGDGDIGHSNQGGGFNPFFQNDGTLRKSGGNGVSTFTDLPINSSATAVFDAESGRLNLSSSGTLVSPAFTGGANGVLEIGGSLGVSGTMAGSGAGHLELTGQLSAVDTGATLNFPTGYFNWTSGILFGGATLTNAGVIGITPATSVRLAGQIKNDGTLRQMGTGSVLFDSSTALTNDATGVYDFAGDGDIAHSNFGAGFNSFIQNAGTFRKSAGIDVSQISSITFNNDATGALDGLSGTLDVAASGIWAGGTINSTSPGVAKVSGTEQLSGPLTGSGTGHFQLAGGIQAVAEGVTLNFPTGYFQWQSGFLQGTGSATGLNNIGSIDVSGSGDKVIFGRVTDTGSMVHTGTGRVLINTNSSLLIAASGVYDFQGDGGWGRSTVGGGGGPFVEVDGTLIKSGGTGTSLVDGGVDPINFNLVGGTIHVESGTLQVDEGGQWQNGGTLIADQDAVLDFSGDRGIAMTGTYSGSGAGQVQFNIDSISSFNFGVDGGHATFDFDPDVLHITGGSIGSGGSASVIGNGTTLVNQGFMTFDGPNKKTIFGSGLINTGTVINAGPGELNVQGVTFDNRLGATFEQRGDAPFTGADGANNAGIFINAGLFEKTAGEGTVNFNGRINNAATGVINVNAGHMSFSRGGSSTGGNFHVDAGTVLEFGPGNDTLNWAGNYTGTGLGRIEMDSSLQGDQTTPGILNFPEGMFHITGGGIFGTLVNNGWIDLSAAASVFTRALFTNNGTFIHSGAADLLLNANTTFINNGVYDLQTDADINVPGDGSGGSMRFINNGLLEKSGGLGVSNLKHDGGDFKEFRFDNSGTVEVKSGTLSINDSIVQVSNQTLTGGTWIVHGFSTLTMPGNSALKINQATITLDGQAANFTNLTGLNSNQGSLTVTNGGNFATTGDLANVGDLTVGPNSVLTVNGNYTQTQSNQLVGWWRGEGNATDSAGTRNGTAINATYITGEFGQAFHFDGNNAFVFLPGNPTLNDFTISAWVRRDDLSRLGVIFSGADDYNFGIQANGQLSLSSFGSNQVTSGPLAITDGNFHHVAVTRDHGQITFYLDGVAQAADGFTPFIGLIPSAIGADTNFSNTDFVGAIDEVSLFSRPLDSSEVNALRTTNDATGLGLLHSELNIGINGRPSANAYGKVNITGAANINGAFNVELDDGFGPIQGDQYPAVSYASHTGTFTPIGGLNPFFDVSVGATQTVINVVASAADISVQSITVPPTSQPGKPVTINYTVQNLADTTVNGSWVDSVYLSSDDEYDPSDLLIGRVTHSGGVGPNGTYSESLTANLPGVVDGNYHIVVIADSRGLVGDTDRTNNKLVSTTETAVTVQEIDFDNLTQLTIHPDEDIYLKLDVPFGGDVQITSTFLNALEAEFFVRQGALPTRSDFDFVASDLTNLNRTITLASPLAGAYYILLHGREGATGGASVSVLAKHIAFDLTSVSPAIGSNLGSATTVLTGAGFTTDTLVELVDGSGNTIATATTNLINPNRVYATFNLVGVAAGTYGVRASKPGFTDTLNAAYQVVVGELGEVSVDLVTPGSLRGGRLYTGYIVYTNTGDTDAVPPIIFLEGSSVFTFDLNATPNVLSDHFLAISPEGPAGVLAPGQSVRVPFRFFGNDMTLEVSSMSPAESAPMDWEELRNAIRPDDAPAGWDQVFDDEFVSAGSTVGDYVQLMDDTATLYQLYEGHTTNDLALLQGFLIAQGFADRDAVIRGYAYLDDTNHPSGRIPVIAVNRATGDTYTAIAMANGLVRIGNVPPGTYDMQFLGVLPPDNLQPVVVPANGVPADQTWVVKTGGVIQGRVGVPVGVVLVDIDHNIQATVTATDEDGNFYTTSVDENGFYQFTGLPAGTYDVSFSTPSTLPVTATGVDVEVGEITGFIDLFSAAGGSISGVVRDAHTNQPVPNVTVSILDEFDNPRTTVTDANGAYTLAGITPGTVSVGVTSSGLVSTPLTNISLVTGQVVTNANLTADFDVLGSITGTVTSGGSFVSNAGVDIIQNGTIILSTTTTSLGIYLLQDVLPGTYTLSIQAFGYQDFETSVTVGTHANVTQNVSLDKAAIISGTVTATGTDDNGTPITYALPELDMMLVDADGKKVLFTTDESGSYSIGQLSPGTYQIMVADGSSRQTVQIVNNTDHPVVNFNLSTGIIGGFLNGYADESIDVELQKNGVTVATTTVGGNGAYYFTLVAPGTYDIQFSSPDHYFAPLTGQVVTEGNFTDLGEVSPPAPLSATVTFADAVTHQHTTTEGIASFRPVDSERGESRFLLIDATGVVTLPDLVPGDYILEGAIQGYPLTKKIVTITNGSNNLTLDMAAGGTLSGQITDDLSTPLVGVTVTAYDPAHPELFWPAITDDNGNYSLDLPVGNYTVVVSDLRDDVPSALHLSVAPVTNVSITAAATTAEDVQLTIGPATIMGILNGSSVDGVNTAPLNGTVVLQTLDGISVAQTTADEDGNYTFEGVTPGDYLIVVNAGGYAFTPTTVLGIHSGTNAGNNPAGVWVTPTSAGDFPPDPEFPIPDDGFASILSLALMSGDGSDADMNAMASANFFGSDDGLAVDLQFDSIQGLLSKGRALIADFLKEPHAAGRIGNAGAIPDDCPEALAAFKRVLQLQKISDGFFDAWHMRWESTVDVAFANLGLAGTKLLELSATLLGKAKFFSSAFDELAPIEQGLLKSISDPSKGVLSTIEELDKIHAIRQSVNKMFQIAKDDLNDVKGAIKVIKTESVVEKGLTSVADVGHALAKIDLTSVKGFFSSLVNVGEKMVNLTLSLAKTADNLIGVIKAFKDVAPTNPVAKAFVDKAGIILNAIEVVKAAAQGGMDGFHDLLDLNDLQAKYERSIQLRDAAFESFLDTLANCEHDDHKKTDKPTRPRTREQLRQLFTQRSTDPNNIAGPEGGGDQHAMRVDELFPYQIQFENKPEATAAAQEVTITQQLDSDLDWSTFELTDFGFGDQVIEIPAGRNFYETRLDLTATLGFFVDFSAGIDLNTGIVTWKFTTIDPETGDLPPDAETGFLPPDDASGKGAGFVEYIIKPKQTLTTGDTINAQASIVFDDNAPLATAVYTNLIDTGVPTSTVNALPATEEFPSFQVSWTGTDDAVGPTGGGVATYDVYVSDNNGPFEPFLLGTTDTSAIFHGQVNHTYSFYSVATDVVGFVQTTPAGAQTSTQVLDELFDFGDAPDSINGVTGNYPTLLQNDGARHKLGSGLFLGSTVDREFDGQPTATANGDDTAGAPDDEDGVILPELVRGTTAHAAVTASLAGKLDAWVDFNGDGDWNDPGEQIATSLALNAGSNDVAFLVPAGATTGTTFVRFRLSSAGGLAPNGQAADGEVEDYQVAVSNPYLNVNSGAVDWSKQQPPVSVLPFVTVNTTGLENGTLTININAVGSKKKVLDQFNFGSVSSIGTAAAPQFANGQLTLVVHLSANVTNSAIQSFLRGITFSTKGKGLKTESRTMNVTLEKAGGSSSTVSQTIHVHKKPAKPD